MHTRFTKVLLMSAIAGCFATSAMAQSYLDGTSKMRGQFGDMPRTEYRANYRAVAPQQTTENMAQAQTEERRFSYAPAPKTEKRETAKPQAEMKKDAQTAQNNTQTQRRFSYEPGTTTNYGVMRSRQNSLPMYALPRTDSRKLGGG